MKERNWNGIWIKVLAAALSAKMVVLVAMLFNFHSGLVFFEDEASAASKSKKASSSLENDIEQQCNPELLSLLRTKMAKLDEREDQLQKKEEDLRLLQKDIQEKIKQLKELQQKLEGPVKKRRFEEEARLQHLAGVYSSMDPVRAAALLDKLDEETVTKLFAIMKSKKVAKILANMSPEKAAGISQRLYGKDDEEY